MGEELENTDSYAAVCVSAVRVTSWPSRKACRFATSPLGRDVSRVFSYTRCTYLIWRMVKPETCLEGLLCSCYYPMYDIASAVSKGARCAPGPRVSQAVTAADFSIEMLPTNIQGLTCLRVPLSGEMSALQNKKLGQGLDQKVVLLSRVTCRKQTCAWVCVCVCVCVVCSIECPPRRYHNNTVPKLLHVWWKRTKQTMAEALQDEGGKKSRFQSQ